MIKKKIGQRNCINALGEDIIQKKLHRINLKKNPIKGQRIEQPQT